jgi:hypothetical protein
MSGACWGSANVPGDSGSETSRAATHQQVVHQQVPTLSIESGRLTADKDRKGCLIAVALPTHTQESLKAPEPLVADGHRHNKQSIRPVLFRGFEPKLILAEPRSAQW